MTCKCRTQDECPKDGDGVCGSDGQTYINKCQLDATACANNKQIQQLHVGPCGKKHNPVNFKEDFRLTLTDGVLQPGVPTTRSSYNQEFLQPGVLQPGVLTTRGLTTRGLRTRSFYNQGLLHPGVFQPGVLRSGVSQSGVLYPHVLYKGVL